MKPIIQIFIAIIILIACFKLGEIKGRWDIARQFLTPYDKFFKENKSWLQKYNAIEREEIWRQFQANGGINEFVKDMRGVANYK